MHPASSNDQYVHRSGRTARAGRSGTCIVFYTPKELYLLKSIERHIKTKIEKVRHRALPS